MEVEPDVVLVAVADTVNAFRTRLGEKSVRLKLTEDLRLADEDGGGTWDLRGKALAGSSANLAPVALSDEYWFSWKRFHPESTLVRM